MSDSTIDIIGEIIWYFMWFTPLVTVPLAIKLGKRSSIPARIAIGLLLAVLISAACFAISMGIVFRNGLGPT